MADFKETLTERGKGDGIGGQKFPDILSLEYEHKESTK